MTPVLIRFIRYTLTIKTPRACGPNAVQVYWKTAAAIFECSELSRAAK